MPAFFIVSGFLYHPHHLSHTIRSLFVPVILLSLLHFSELVLTKGYVYTTSHYDFLQYRYGLGTGYFSGIWFLWSLMGCRLIMGISWLRKSDKYAWTVGITMIFITLLDEWNVIHIDRILKGYFIARFIPAMPFFIMGFYLHKLFQNNYHVRYRLVTLICLILYLVLPLINKAEGLNANSYGYSYLLFIVTAVSGTFIVLSISKHLPRSLFFETFSIGTLFILGFHSTIYDLLDMISPDWLQEYKMAIYPSVTFAVSYPLILLSRKYCPWILGK